MLTDADYKLEELVPGPYPETKKEREAAAKKYGLLPQEYEPYPDDGFGKGEYPKMPMIGGDARGHWYPWDYPEHRKDFGDPVSIICDKALQNANPYLTCTVQCHVL